MADTGRGRGRGPRPAEEPRGGAPGGQSAELKAHEWISFEDPDEERTWVFDVTFLLSPWTCIFGNGCQGVLTGPSPELVQGCCSYGAHFVDDEDVESVEAAAATLTADQWQFRREGQRRGTIKFTPDGERITRQVKDACIFLNRPEFPGGPGCALHRAALERGERPLDLKPDVCWQLPLRRDEEEHEDGRVTSTIRQWDRRHWGEGGFEFHWWCTESSDAFIGAVPVYESMRDELVEMTNPKVYDLLVTYLEARRADHALRHPADPSVATSVAVAAPTLRKR